MTGRVKTGLSLYIEKFFATSQTYNLQDYVINAGECTALKIHGKNKQVYANVALHAHSDKATGSLLE